jgi:hypothetical protein
MKAIPKFLFGFLLLVSASAQAMEINPRHSGSWYNPQQSGHGISVEVINAETLVIYWYAYHPNGTPMWLLSVADIEGDTATGEAYYYSGMRFGTFDPTELTEQRWGELSLTFLDCRNARLSYDSPLSPFGAGEVELVRLTFIDGMGCASLIAGRAGNYSSGLEIPPYAGWPINSFAWIAPDGTLAYQVATDGEVRETGYGQLYMSGEDTFNFTAMTADGLRHGTGLFEPVQVTLDLGELGVLSESMDPAYFEAITLDDIAGDYSGPDAIFFVTVDENGEFSFGSIGGESVGTLTIPRPGYNQVVLAQEGGMSGLGVLHRATGYLLFINRRGDWVWGMPWFSAN